MLILKPLIDGETSLNGIIFYDVNILAVFFSHMQSLKGTSSVGEGKAVDNSIP